MAEVCSTCWWRLVEVCGGMWYRLVQVGRDMWYRLVKVGEIVKVTRLCMESDITRIYPTTPSDQAACPRVVRPRPLKKEERKKVPTCCSSSSFSHLFESDIAYTLSLPAFPHVTSSSSRSPPFSSSSSSSTFYLQVLFPLVLHHSPLPRLLLLFISKRQILPIHNFSSSSPHLHAG